MQMRASLAWVCLLAAGSALGFVALQAPPADTRAQSNPSACGAQPPDAGGYLGQTCIGGVAVPICAGKLTDGGEGYDDATCAGWRPGTSCSYVGQDPQTGAELNACLPDTSAWTLEALNVSPDVQANLTDPGQVLVPSFHGTGEINLLTTRHRNFAIALDEDFHVAPKPSVGTSDDVAHRIRFMPGVAGGDMSVKMSFLPRYLNAIGSTGAEGIQVRVGARGEYEAADVTPDPTSGQINVSGTQFFVGATEMSVGFWLKYAYVGVLWDHFYVAGAAPDTLKTELQDSNAIKGELVVRVQGSQFSKADGGTPSADNYFVFTVGRDRPWAPPAVQLQYAVTFSPL
jgi:hypothetical protein